MRLFSFSKKVKLYAPVDGTLTALNSTDDTTGFTVVPQRHHVYSPVSGTVSALAPEQHVIELTSGKLTVKLQLGTDQGSGAAAYVHEGDTVTPETPIAFMAQDDLATAGAAEMITVIVDNTKGFNLSTGGQVNHDQEVATVVAK
ncbi:PTS cellobiose transporter subunit IIA [Lactiplantibacillus garii]|uniref:PTS cellobiose transporter subunit IIA n=1 Tax=Lactiplantibacillus garii TaxID=2306423 RepID=A0A3R8QQC5_9LACO|nr:PTS glucose transporter subunit IIA [Lactiplantibacillus garii]RRK09999.1 PTS cellobiose transporter subunit IIA [Lactiplantibacillus garii]